MRRTPVFALSLLLPLGLAACGNKGPLTLPPARPAATATPAAATSAPAAAASSVAPPLDQGDLPH